MKPLAAVGALIAVITLAPMAHADNLDPVVRDAQSLDIPQAQQFKVGAVIGGLCAMRQIPGN